MPVLRGKREHHGYGQHSRCRAANTDTEVPPLSADKPFPSLEKGLSKTSPKSTRLTTLSLKLR